MTQANLATEKGEPGHDGSIDVKFNESDSSKLTVSGFGATILSTISLSFTTAWGASSDFINNERNRIRFISEIGLQQEVNRTLLR